MGNENLRSSLIPHYSSLHFGSGSAGLGLSLTTTDHKNKNPAEAGPILIF
jgi:hypothetical protein